MEINKNNTAVVFIDPQNEVLSDKGLAWGLVGDSVRENKTVENMERIFKAAKENGFEVFISPHYFFPTDGGGNSTDLSRPTRWRPRCSLVAEA
jgi:nicotinamidase-related amidase